MTELATQNGKKIEEFSKEKLSTYKVFINGRKIEVFGKEELDERREDFDGAQELVRFNPGGYLFNGEFQKLYRHYYNFQFQPDDILCLAFPKTGQTWTLELLWNMKNNPHLDNQIAENAPNLLNLKTPFFEFDLITGTKNPMPEVREFCDKHCPGADPDKGLILQLLDAQQSPRIIKSHFPLSLWPDNLLENTKVVYVARNPKDTVVSFEHFSRITKLIGFKKDMDTLVDYFVKDNLMFSPYWRHLREAWEKRNHENFLLIFYEDMIYDIIGQLKKIDKFIGTNLTDKQLDNIANYCSFDSMEERTISKDPILKSFNGPNGYFKKAKVGNWREKLTPEQAYKIDLWTNQHLPDIPFKYE